MSNRTTNSGYGKEFYENGKVRYEGEWSNGEWNGNGKQFDEDGQLRYEGGFQNNEWHGKGKNFDEDGKLVYDGEWKNGNEWNGKGKLNMSINKLSDQDQDRDNRILTLYYDVNINTIFNRTKLQNIKNKFWKYVNYLIKYEKNNIQPNILRFQQNCWKYKMTGLKEPKVSGDPGYFRREYEKCYIELNSYITMQTHYNNNINLLGMRIKQIKTHQNFVHKNYKKCAHCEKINTFILSGCKSKHKLCSECIYDKTECPVCEEDLGLIHCDICMVYKKELVDTGCKNKHQTCKDCLDKIQTKKKRRALDHNIRNGYHRDSEPYYFKYKCPFCRGAVNIECGRDEYYHNYDDDDNDDDNDNADYESDEEFWRRGAENDNIIRRDGITMRMENLRETYPSRRYTRSEREEEEEEEDRRSESEEDEEDRRQTRAENRRESRAENWREHRENARR